MKQAFFVVLALFILVGVFWLVTTLFKRVPTYQPTKPLESLPAAPSAETLEQAAAEREVREMTVPEISPQALDQLIQQTRAAPPPPPPSSADLEAVRQAQPPAGQ